VVMIREHSRSIQEARTFQEKKERFQEASSFDAIFQISPKKKIFAPTRSKNFFSDADTQLAEHTGGPNARGALSCATIRASTLPRRHDLQKKL
jgi:hypothetical protein